MRPTQRQRVFLSLCACLLIGPVVAAWALDRADAIWGTVRGTSLGQVSVPWTIVELALGTGLLLAVLVGLTLWCGRPLRQLSATVRRLGPQNVAERTDQASGRGEYGSLAGAIDAMLDRVAEGHAGQRRFAANASHELRTPLALQRTLIEVGMSGDPTPDQLQLLTRQLLHTNERNEALIESLLVLAEADQAVVARTPQRLDAIAADVVAVHRQLADAAGVRLETELEPVTVAGEATLLERLITNLVHNGIKYNVPGGEVCLRVGPGQPVLRVTNTGPVVPAESVSRLFEPFRRGRGDRLDHSAGAGLGLTIARSITQAHAGHIEAAAPVAGGLDVTVELPAPT
ncbi:ATP-binding protein [Goekera deserti]|uniref:HAMP domain-containing sensor histidine kinase n=1 Tax=Goekera deserti TaxID=2497753 RepID=UPI00192EC361|nr:ATP-binding protein [Goekera deserti]